MKLSGKRLTYDKTHGRGLTLLRPRGATNTRSRRKRIRTAHVERRREKNKTESISEISPVLIIYDATAYVLYARALYIIIIVVVVVFVSSMSSSSSSISSCRATEVAAAAVKNSTYRIHKTLENYFGGYIILRACVCDWRARETIYTLCRQPRRSREGTRVSRRAGRCGVLRRLRKFRPEKPSFSEESRTHFGVKTRARRFVHKKLSKCALKTNKICVLFCFFF